MYADLHIGILDLFAEASRKGRRQGLARLGLWKPENQTGRVTRVMRMALRVYHPRRSYSLCSVCLKNEATVRVRTVDLCDEHSSTFIPSNGR